MNGNDVTRALHELFETQVINHGDYSVVYAESCTPGTALVIGYRHTPLELVLVPVELTRPPQAGGDAPRVTARAAGPVSSIDLSNVATLADTGTGYRVETVTGFRAGFEVEDTAHISLSASTGVVEDDALMLLQDQEAEDFHEFMTHFMDILDGFYQVPEAPEFLEDASAHSLAA
ncbi:hypothetical protein [Citricoccus sp.]|uniref:hypothetical protein n=1 Tax=Citricoccus sp. TaxID=1978372 RepID=UPI002615C2F3|nr:hypothetical protein [Citricoccus sp.]HRO30740.1 hypothetical protein [Citricoccus sp.]HRO94699.1 hypothetical protein [Citricoccus sp.]